MNKKTITTFSLLFIIYIFSFSQSAYADMASVNGDGAVYADDLSLNILLIAIIFITIFSAIGLFLIRSKVGKK